MGQVAVTRVLIGGFWGRSGEVDFLVFATFDPLFVGNSGLVY